MKTNEILRSKGSTVYSISPDATLADVVHKLVEHNCGSLLVTADEKILGIITERDILRTLAEESRRLREIKVSERMTTELITGGPEDAVESVMGLLTEKRIRHLPIMQQEQLLGIISIGDVVKAQHDHLRMENHYLKSYIQS